MSEKGGQRAVREIETERMRVIGEERGKSRESIGSAVGEQSSERGLFAEPMICLILGFHLGSFQDTPSVMFDILQSYFQFLRLEGGMLMFGMLEGAGTAELPLYSIKHSGHSSHSSKSV